MNTEHSRLEPNFIALIFVVVAGSRVQIKESENPLHDGKEKPAAVVPDCPTNTPVAAGQGRAICQSSPV